MLDAKFYDSLRGLRLAVGHRSSMNLSGNRKSVQKGASAEFSDFREYLPGDDIRRIDWNAFGRLDRLYIKEYMEEKEALISILLDTSSSMNYGSRKKSLLACELAAVVAYLSLNNMDQVAVYDMQRMRQPFVIRGGKRAFPGLVRWLEECTFDGQGDVGEAVRQLPGKGQGAAVIISDFLQESFLPDFLKGQRGQAAQGKQTKGGQGKQRSALQRRQTDIPQERRDGVSGLLHMEDKSTLRLTLDAAGLRAYENALNAFTVQLGKECAGAGAFYAVCSTAQDLRQLIFKDLRLLYDI